jgi:alpha-ketoglutaric semialdehyde dehydrogenase
MRGSFVRNQGLLLAIKSDALDKFKKALAIAIADVNSATMLTPGICASFKKLSGSMMEDDAVTIIAIR